MSDDCTITGESEGVWCGAEGCACSALLLSSICSREGFCIVYTFPPVHSCACEGLTIVVVNVDLLKARARVWKSLVREIPARVSLARIIPARVRSRRSPKIVRSRRIPIRRSNSSKNKSIKSKSSKRNSSKSSNSRKSSKYSRSESSKSNSRKRKSSKSKSRKIKSKDSSYPNKSKYRRQLDQG